jgi:His-Xaa-Ser system radical SAM maturase HxsC
MYLWSHGTAYGLEKTVLGRLIVGPRSPATREDSIPFGTARDVEDWAGDCAGFPAILCIGPTKPREHLLAPVLWAPTHLEYLTQGDVVALHPSGTVNVLYRRSSPHNTILLTERCNSYCLMCSQPPKAADDSYRVPQILRLLELIDIATLELGISGGEPTLLGQDFLAIVSKARDFLPSTALHVLTNGRRFCDAGFAEALGAIGHADLMLGVPLYADVDSVHDYVVQAPGAFEETMNGLYNLAIAGVRLEVRVVLHKQTYGRLPQLASFIARNLPFVEHVALMGLEMYGFTPPNLGVLWIDPVEYQTELEEATLTLAGSGMNVSIYNHQLCTIPRSIWSFARKSISDWKNVYLDCCSSCGVRAYCGGFFQSATKVHSSFIKPLEALDAESDSFLRVMHGMDEASAAT